MAALLNSYPSGEDCLPLTIPFNNGKFYHPEFFNSFTEWRISTTSTIARRKTTVVLKASHLWTILMANLEADNGANKHQNWSS